MTLELDMGSVKIFKKISSMKLSKREIVYVANGIEYKEYLPNVVSFAILSEDQALERALVDG